MGPLRQDAARNRDAHDMQARISVIVIDDSALMRSLLSEIINAQPDLEVVGMAPDPLVARELIRTLDPDVLTLDVEMPRMDGLAFLEKLMRLRPTPVVMVSTLTERSAEVTLRALELGAVDCVAKPRLGIAHGMREMGTEICDKIRMAARARLRRHPPSVPTVVPATASAKASRAQRCAAGQGKIIAVGASTGGTEAIRELLAGLPPDCPPVLIAQHMPAGFTRSFAARLDAQLCLAVSEAVDGEPLRNGRAYIAPGDRHLCLARRSGEYVVALEDGAPVNRHRPSIEVLFRSVARVAGRNALGVMLTGMGRDGAQAMLEMRQAGSFNIAQDESSCVVFGLPREAIAAGAVHAVHPLPQIASRLLEAMAATAMAPAASPPVAP
jgi:two-component system chemotaxis response regulator CheB